MTDTFLSSARFVVSEDLKDLREGVDGLPGEALDWKPAGAGTNSIAVLVTHVLHSTRSWLSVAVGAPLPDRDRESEFRVKSDDPAALADFMHDFSRQIMALLDNAGDADWSATRKTHARQASTARPGDTSEQVPASWAVLHAIEHLREHIAHVGLTRQLWEARG
jgi:uncharacterized damage-inducible protein DinB